MDYQKIILREETRDLLFHEGIWPTVTYHFNFALWGHLRLDMPMPAERLSEFREGKFSQKSNLIMRHAAGTIGLKSRF